MRYRSRNDIYASILQSAQKEENGIKITRIMYYSYLSYTQMIEFLKQLTRFGLLVYNEETTRYEITPKGQRFMGVYEKMDEILKVEEIS